MNRSSLLFSRQWQLDSAFEALEPVCEQVQKLLAFYKLDGNAFEVDLILREAFNNSVEHGHFHNISNKVQCTIRLFSEMIEIEVEDQGKGFDWLKVTSDLQDQDVPEGGRGLLIYKMYADTIEFNDTGNRVLLRKKLMSTSLNGEVSAPVHSETDSRPQDELIVTIENDLTASVSESVKKKLTASLEDNPQIRILTLDLSLVKTIDSRGLAVLLSIYKTLLSRKGTVRLIQVSKELTMMLMCVNLNRHFEIIELKS
jgi:serine/threonine-protein kinase RsbW